MNEADDDAPARRIRPSPVHRSWWLSRIPRRERDGRTRERRQHADELQRQVDVEPVAREGCAPAARRQRTGRKEEAPRK